MDCQLVCLLFYQLVAPIDATMHVPAACRESYVHQIPARYEPRSIAQQAHEAEYPDAIPWIRSPDMAGPAVRCASTDFACLLAYSARGPCALYVPRSP